MTVWNDLDPYRSLGCDDSRYVPRPAGEGSDIVAAIQAGMGGGRIAVNGPAGVGKSTELAAAEQRLREKGEVCRVVLDTMVDLQKLDEGMLFAALGNVLAPNSRAGKILAKLSQAAMASAPLFQSFASLTPNGECPSSAERIDAFRTLLLSLAEQGKTFTLLIDGLEKAPEPVVHRTLIALAEASMGTPTRLAIVLSPASVVGPQAHELLRLYKPLELRPIDFQGNAGKQFFKLLVEKRIGVSIAKLADPIRFAINEAIALSGGIPRVFLQLLQDAAGYAALAGRIDPVPKDVQQARADHMDSLRYLLIQGDVDAIRRATGTDGAELELERRARFLSHGLMLLQGRGRETRLIPHPLLKPLLEQRTKTGYEPTARL